MIKRILQLEQGEKMIKGTGWVKSLPDFRDYTDSTNEIQEIIRAIPEEYPSNMKAVNLMQYCSPVEDQGSIGSCTAMALAGIVEYNQRKVFGKYVEASKLFMYKTTRNLLKQTGDTGAYIRTAMKSLVMCGVPPEEFWPYDVENYDEEPSSFAYALADNYEGVKYFCLDPSLSDARGNIVLERVKRLIRKEIPLIFGFYIFPSFEFGNKPGHIPFPGDEEAEGGHAIMAIGYNDEYIIENTQTQEMTKGALLIRNSWGIGWGDKGYGWLPYKYVTQRLALDFWGLISMNWVDTKRFEL